MLFNIILPALGIFVSLEGTVATEAWTYEITTVTPHTENNPFFKFIGTSDPLVIAAYAAFIVGGILLILGFIWGFCFCCCCSKQNGGRSEKKRLSQRSDMPTSYTNPNAANGGPDSNRNSLYVDVEEYQNGTSDKKTSSKNKSKPSKKNKDGRQSGGSHVTSVVVDNEAYHDDHPVMVAKDTDSTDGLETMGSTTVIAVGNDEGEATEYQNPYGTNKSVSFQDARRADDEEKGYQSATESTEQEDELERKKKSLDYAVPPPPNMDGQNTVIIVDKEVQKRLSLGSPDY